MAGEGAGQGGERRAPWVPAADPGPPIPHPPHAGPPVVQGWGEPPVEAPPSWYGSPAHPPATGPQPPPWSGPVPGLPPAPPPERSGGGRALWIGIALAVLAVVGAGTWLVLELLLDAGGTPTATTAATTSAAPDTGSETTPTQEAPRPSGPSSPLQPVGATATCQAEPGIDAAGNAITYSPAMAIDGVQATAWRCAGSAVGQRIVFDFGRPVTIESLGLVPGYAKVDPADGTDRFTQNHTVTGVTWYFDDASAVEQVVPDPRPAFDTFQLDEPVVTTRVVLEIASTGNPGAERDFTPVSEVSFTGW